MRDDVKSLKNYARVWKQADSELRSIKRDEMRKDKIYQSILTLDENFTAVINSTSPSKTSGLVEQQQIFLRLRKK
jgi:hypothetical protein